MERLMNKLRNYLWPTDPLSQFGPKMRWLMFFFLLVRSSDRIFSLFFSFCMQLSSNYQDKGNFKLALVFLMLYFLQETFRGCYTFINDNVRKRYSNCSVNMIAAKESKLLETCRGKVYTNSEDDSEIKEQMETSKLINTVKGFLNARVNFIESTFSNVVGIVLIITTIIGMLSTTGVSDELLPSFAGVLLAMIIVYSILSVFERRFRRANYKEVRKLRDKKDAAFNSIRNNEPISQKQSSFRIKIFLKILDLLNTVERIFSNKMNVIALIKSLTKALGCFVLIGFYLRSCGGIDNLSSNVFVQLIAFVTLFQNLSREINYLIMDLMFYVNNITELDEYYPNFMEISTTHNESASKEILDIEQIEIAEGAKFAYPVTIKNTKPFSLSVKETLRFKKGDVVSIFGKTGNGKTTFTRIITSHLKWSNTNHVSYYPSLGQNAIPSSLIISRDSNLGSDNLLSEITCIEDSSTISIEEVSRLIYILKGVDLYDELYEKNPNVIQQLQKSHFNEYSSGQRARLVLTNLLYNIDDEASIIAFDEITSSLDDDTTLKVMQFLIGELGKNRILLFVSHQKITKQFANIHLDVAKGCVFKS